MLALIWDENNYMQFLQPCSTFLVHKSTLCSPKMEFTLYLTLSLVTRHVWIYFPDLAKFIVSNVTQVKERSYYNQHDINQFILSLTIEIFRCLHKHANVLLHDYANAIWGFKRLKSPPFFVLIKKIQLHAKDANASILS